MTAGGKNAMSLFDLKGKVALVTGGNGGIGLGMARGFAAAGANVVIAGRNAEKSRGAASEIAAMGVKTAVVEVNVADDASCRAMIDATMKEMGRIDILVNNAGINIRKRPETYSMAEWREVLSINLDGAFYCSHAVYPALKKSGGGKIINIGSMMSIFGAAFATPYSASKGGIVQMTKSLATAWAVDNIQVNAILPGWIDTELTQKAREQVDGLNANVLRRTPAGRWGVPDDFSGIAIFLGSQASDFVTGTAIAVDGGFSIQG
jgi:2-dehydro-3-deoxy-D-gluconate 5-dehydrogenase